jgi:GNAT superfamily N-acetyltransferase
MADDAFSDYLLRRPATAAEWRTYHDIRRSVLFDKRGEAYDENHPDEFKTNNHPLILWRRAEALGVIRIDIEETTAIFRRVAIRGECQRQGHGRLMLALSEAFARDRHCNEIRSFVNPEAVGFYERAGFLQDLTVPTSDSFVAMVKNL